MKTQTTPKAKPQADAETKATPEANTVIAYRWTGIDRKTDNWVEGWVSVAEEPDFEVSVSLLFDRIETTGVTEMSDEDVRDAGFDPRNWPGGIDPATAVKQLFIAYDDIYQDWLLGEGDGTHVTNPVRAKLAVEMLQSRIGEFAAVHNPTPEGSYDFDLEALKSIHDESYVDATLAGDNTAWNYHGPQTAAAGFAMFRGTMRCFDSILFGSSKVAFNPQGAKHHAQKAHSSGFCVFNDFAWAALEFQKAGLKPLYLDWDIHAGDGVYDMLKGSGIPTISIHSSGIYPMHPEMNLARGERGPKHNPEQHGYNFNVAAGDGDDWFKQYIDEAAKIIDEYKPDVILLAAGADGHVGFGNLGQLATYTDAGFRYAAEMVAAKALAYSKGRVLIGGAGGYQPLKETPETWALVVETIYNQICRGGKNE